ncbi:hypothetical protein KSP39_PZI017448 [Platanthera zijinensis]|uniref:Uncharacterized protein n=1 Tax=Platanthera zijinensis TaxID=2320716 RepID=A0AAP0FZL0_9ASPA
MSRGKISKNGVEDLTFFHSQLDMLFSTMEVSGPKVLQLDNVPSEHPDHAIALSLSEEELKKQISTDPILRHGEVEPVYLVEFHSPDHPPSLPSGSSAASLLYSLPVASSPSPTLLVGLPAVSRFLTASSPSFLWLHPSSPLTTLLIATDPWDTFPDHPFSLSAAGSVLSARFLVRASPRLLLARRSPLFSRREPSSSLTRGFGLIRAVSLSRKSASPTRAQVAPLFPPRALLFARDLLSSLLLRGFLAYRAASSIPAASLSVAISVLGRGFFPCHWCSHSDRATLSSSLSLSPRTVSSQTTRFAFFRLLARSFL